MAINLNDKPNNITEYPNSFKRQGAFPLEREEVHYSLEEARAYASKANGIAYVGQALSVVEDGKVHRYIITDEEGTLERVGGVSAHGETEPQETLDDGEVYFQYGDNITDVYVNSGQVSGTNIILNRTDGNKVTIDASSLKTSLEENGAISSVSGDGGAIDVETTEGAVSIALKINNTGNVDLTTDSYGLKANVSLPTVNDGTLTLKASNGVTATQKQFTANDNDNITFEVKHSDQPTSGTAAKTETGSGRTYVTSVLVDNYGHVAKVTTATEKDQEVEANTWRPVKVNGTAIGDTETLNLKNGNAISLSEKDGEVTISHADTSSASSNPGSSNGTNQFIKSITLDSYGHLQNVSSSAVSFPSRDISVTKNSGGGINDPLIYVGSSDNYIQFEGTEYLWVQYKDINTIKLASCFGIEQVGSWQLYKIRQRADIQNKVDGKYAIAFGEASAALSDFSYTSGGKLTSSGIGAHCEGFSTNAAWQNNRISPILKKISTNQGVTESVANANIATIEDEWNQGGTAQFALAAGYGAHVEGSDCLAIGQGSHAEGQGTYAKGLYSHAEGSRTRAEGEDSHAEGNHSIARGDYSHAGGSYAEALHLNSFAQGSCLRTALDNQIILGKANAIDNEQAFIIGWGDDSNEENPIRKNIFTIDTNGNTWMRGGLWVTEDSVFSAPLLCQNKLTIQSFQNSSFDNPSVNINGHCLITGDFRFTNLDVSEGWGKTYNEFVAKIGNLNSYSSDNGKTLAAAVTANTTAVSNLSNVPNRVEILENKIKIESTGGISIDDYIPETLAEGQILLVYEEGGDA